ncbi:unnamed protein product [Cuscuta europaea]|uniref:Ubiquitin-like protease family profile domain-containing protein n=1 Tax=Cuscuta europaea TaxID=41803 RepID=A0A9P0ZFD4_CUSEU|nr:unnamed protein product [Cuscuta europaea]
MASRTSPLHWLQLHLLCTSLLLFFNVFRNMHNDGESRKKVIWKQMKCAKQTSGLECGFYVMIFIYDAVKYITSGQDMEQVYERIKVDGPLSSEDIAEVRDADAIYVVIICCKPYSCDKFAIKLCFVF